MRIPGLISIIAANIVALWCEVAICLFITNNISVIICSIAIGAATTLFSSVAIGFTIKKYNSRIGYSIDLC